MEPSIIRGGADFEKLIFRPKPLLRRNFIMS